VGVVGREVAFENARAAGSRHSAHADVVLEQERHAREPTEPLSARALLVHGPRLGARALGGAVQDRVQLGIVRGNTRERLLGDLLRPLLTALNTVRDLDHAQLAHDSTSSTLGTAKPPS
jgi:hypothetical protein